jgi:hypothetical protein
MALSFGKAADNIKKFDGSNIHVEKFLASITSAVKNSKDSVSEDLWLSQIEEKLSGRALLLFQASEFKSREELTKVFTETFDSAEHRATIRREMEALTQLQGESCTNYLLRKSAKFKSMSWLSADEQLVAAKAGFYDAQTKDKFLGATSMPMLIKWAEESDANRPKSEPVPVHPQGAQVVNVIPQVNAMGRGAGGRAKRFNGNCHWCGAHGHKEVDCRKKKNNQPRTQQSQGRGKKNYQVFIVDDDTGKPVTNNTNDSSYSRDIPHLFSINPTEMPLSNIMIGQVKLCAGWDSGASISGINEASFNRLSKNIRAKLVPQSLPVRVANGSIVTSLGYLRAVIDFGQGISKPVMLNVIPGLPREVVIGNNFIKGNVDLRLATDNAAFFAKERKLVKFFNAPAAPAILVNRQTLLKPGVPTRVPILFRKKGDHVIASEGELSSLEWVDGLVNDQTQWVLCINKSDCPLSLDVGPAPQCRIFTLDQLNLVEASQVKPGDELPKVESWLEADINPNAPEEAKVLLRDKLKGFYERMKGKPWGTNMIEHRIRLRDEFSNRCNAYVYGPKEVEFIEQKTREMLAEPKIIKKSIQANVSPVVVAHHPQSKKMRFCVNYQKLNAATIRENHVMPRIWDSLQLLAASDWFSRMDMLSGFWQVPLAKESVPLTAFITNEGIFEYLFMPFGLVNASFTFQRLMDEVLGDLKPKVASPYIDDVNIHSRGSVMDHVHAIDKVLAKLEAANLRPNFAKCKFLYQELDVFGHLISRNTIKVDPRRLERIRSITTLRNVHDVRVFLGLCAVYYRFIPRYAHLAEPLIRLTRKNVSWEWSDVQVKALNDLKSALLSATFLSIPNASLPFRIHVDASDYAAGYYLYQIIDGRERIIAFGGKSYSSSERNYGTGQKELYSVFLALEEFRWCVYGRVVYVETDHQAWGWISKFSKKPPKSCAYWLMELLDYNPFIDWIPGEFNTVADALSRLWEPENVMLFAVEELFAQDVSSLTTDEKLRLVRAVHGDEIHGDHARFAGTLRKVRQRYLFKNMAPIVRAVVDSCPECLDNKPKRIKAPMTPIVALEPMNIIGIDDIQLPPANTHNYRYILIVIDYFSKWIELHPMVSNDANSIISSLKLFMANNQKPRLIVSDGAKMYTTSETFKSFLKQHGIVNDTSAREHQQANGEAEREVKEFIPLLRIKCANDIEAWPSKLLFTQAARNSAIRQATKCSPFFIKNGYEPRMLSESIYDDYEVNAANRYRQVLADNLEEKCRQEAQYNKAATNVPVLNSGDNVVIRKAGHVPKLDKVNEPAVVVSQRGPNSYTVRKENGNLAQVNVRDIQKDVRQSSMAQPQPVEVSQSAIPQSVVAAEQPASNSFSASELVGKKIRVYWPKYNRYYDGSIASASRSRRHGSHIVNYKDGEFYEYLSDAPKGKEVAKFHVRRSNPAVDYKNVMKNVAPVEDDSDTSDEDYTPNEKDLVYNSSTSSTFSSHSSSSSSDDEADLMSILSFVKSSLSEILAGRVR